MLQQFLEDKASSRSKREAEKEEEEAEVERPSVYPGHMRRVESYGSVTVSTFGRRDSNDANSTNNGRGSMQSRLDRSDRSLRSSGNSYENIIRGDLSCFGEEYEVPTKTNKDKQQKMTFGTRIDMSLRKSTGSIGDISALTSESVGASLSSDQRQKRRSSLFSMFGQDSIGDDILDSLQTETNNRTDTHDHNYEITCRRSVTEVLSMEDNRSHDFRLTFDDPTASSASSSRKSKSRPKSSRKKFNSRLKQSKEMQDLIQCILSNEGMVASASDGQNPSAKEALNTSDRSGASSRSSRRTRWLGSGLENEGAATSSDEVTNEVQEIIKCMLSNEGLGEGQNNSSAKADLDASELSGASSRSSRRTRRWCPKKAAKSKQQEENMSSARSGQTLLVDWGEFSSDDEGDYPRPIDDSERALYGMSFRQMDDSLTFVDSDEEDSIDRWIDDALMNGVGRANTRDEDGIVRRRCSAVEEEGLDEMDVSERS